jgi:two-component system chemotaxis sensor kinase CheA
VHAVRNAVDHGIETPEERSAAGKSMPANIYLRARVENADLVIELQDDGRGINWNKLAERAKQRGLPHHTQNELLEVLFMDGVSTRDEVSDLSGRGIGMGALRASCLALHGSVEVESQPGKGTLLRCRWDIARVEGLRWIQDAPQRQAS